MRIGNFAGPHFYLDFTQNSLWSQVIKIETGNPLKLSSETWFPQALNHKKQQRFKNSRFISLTLSMQWLLVLLGRFCNSVWHNILKTVNPLLVTPNFIFSLHPSFLLFFHPFSLAGDRSRAESNIRQVNHIKEIVSKKRVPPMPTNSAGTRAQTSWPWTAWRLAEPSTCSSPPTTGSSGQGKDSLVSTASRLFKVQNMWKPQK